MAVLDPVVTTSSSPDYSPYRKAINEIVYSKQQYQSGQQGGNSGLMDWAKNNATQYYNQLPTELASQLRGMNLQDAQALLAGIGKTGPSVAGTPQQTTPTLPQGGNPYDQRVDDLLAQLTGSINSPVNSPYDAQIQALLASLTGRINNPNVVDPRTTDEYAAGKAAIDRQVGDNIRIAQEALGGSGFARSTNLAERAQGIADAGTEYLETQLVPQIAQQLMARDQQGLQNSMMLLNALSQQQGVFDSRQQAQLQNLNSLLGQLTGQQGLFDSRQQNQFQNELGLANLDLSRGQLDLQRQAQNFNEQQAVIRNELDRINSALQRTQTLGSVSQQDAAILGVPAGTPSFQAQEAVARRAHELQVQDRQIAASMAELTKRINADAEQGRLNREASNNQTKINELLRIWEANGKAPAGLEAYGIQPGQAYSPYLTPGQQLDQLQLNDATTAQQERQRIQAMVPTLQKTYNMDPITAEALASVLDNPSLDAALADIQINRNNLMQMGINPKALTEATRAEFSKRSGGQPTAGSGSNFFNIDNAKNTAGSLVGILSWLANRTRWGE